MAGSTLQLQTEDVRLTTEAQRHREEVDGLVRLSNETKIGDSGITASGKVCCSAFRWLALTRTASPRATPDRLSSSTKGIRLSVASKKATKRKGCGGLLLIPHCVVHASSFTPNRTA